ncbi:MAG: hypothetical protein DRQ48_06865 [Gammaproteobacteria bacterium]|nr:MAG: hypothetical protein DRQ48_06865 [Gammaproteobacteria bacterium]
MQNWMNNVLGVQGAGMEGQSRIQQQGFQGTQSMADMLGGTLNSQASLAFQGQKQKNQQQQDFMKFIGQMAASAAGMPGAGGATGGASTPR